MKRKNDGVNSFKEVIFICLVVAILFTPLYVEGQSISHITGTWEFTIGEDQDGTFTIVEDEDRLSGLMDLETSSVTRKLLDITYQGDRLTFRVERLYDTWNVDVLISGDTFEGEINGSTPIKGERLSDTSSAIIDHATVITSLDEQSLQAGKKLYDQVCAACHGADGTSSLPSAISFNSEQFKYGSDPYSMWQTITEGVGQMGAQRWLSPEETYAVIQYIREELIKGSNPQAYFEITDEYLEGLPEPSMSEAELQAKIRKEALSGSQEYGQLYFSDNLGDYGNALYSSLNVRANAALIVELADNVYMGYNPQRMSTVAVWQGQLDLSETKYQLYRGEGEPMIDGKELVGLDRMHWSYQDRYGQLSNLVSERTPFPDDWLEFHGHYQHGETVVLSYSIIGRKILEMPSVQMLEDVPVIQHTLKIGPGESWRKLHLGGLDDRSAGVVREGVFSLSNIEANQEISEQDGVSPENSLIVRAVGEGDSLERFVAAGIQGDTDGMRWMMDNRQLSLYISPSSKSQTVRIHRFSGQGSAQYQAFADFLGEVQGTSVPDPETYTKGGERLWKETIVTQGQLNTGRPRYDPVHYGKKDQNAPENLVTIPENYPYAVDRITLPFDNPWGSWIRPTGFDFFPDGRAIVSTYAGDVWMAEGIDDDLDEIRWQRIATGLYDPFGVKIKDGQIYVICRDRIMRLNDLNGDGETDFYETFFADTDVSDVPVQAYNFSLETDSEGNFLFAKAGQYTHNDEPGNLIRVSADGKTQQSVAIGFRAPNGVTVDPTDRIFVGDNQGNWMPANKINMIEEGGFYGYIPSIGSSNNGHKEYRMRHSLSKYPGEVLPLSFDEPIVWMPQAFDNSPGNGAWTPKEWGPLGDRLVHTSFGKGWAYYVVIDEVDDTTTQAAVSALPFQFDSGTQRAAVSPADGQYYLAGVTGWDDAFAQKYGSFDRIRYTGGEGFVMDAVNVRSNGIAITFNQVLNAEVASQSENYMVKQWNYRWQQRYGSEDWSVKNPDQTGQDDVPVQGVELSSNGKTILLKISEQDLQPVDQMRIQLSLESEEGRKYQDTMYLTIHKVPGRSGE
jgi:cytochrome c5